MEVLLLLGCWRPHAHFQAFLESELQARPSSDASRIELYRKTLDAARHLDLDPAFTVLASCYSSRGRPSHQAPDLLRSLILMIVSGETSICRWAKRLRGEPILAIACGFTWPKTPSASSFHDFCNRLWPDPDIGPVVRRFRSNRRKRPARGAKLGNKHTGIVQRLHQAALRGRRFHRRPERLVQQLLAAVAVRPSRQRGLLDDRASGLALALDGAPLQTGAARFGRKLCSCPAKSGCVCPRRFQDRHAVTGWDSFNNQWYYGYTLYHVTAAHSRYDLPVYVRIVQASRNDSVTGFVSLHETFDLYPDFTFRKVIADSAHDNVPTYELCYQHRAAPYIEPNTRHEGQTHKSPPQGFTASGEPICAQGEVMRPCGFNPGRQRQKWRCPRSCRGDVCACSDSPYGRTLYTYPLGSRRDPPVPRKSEAWGDAYKRRTSVERSLKRSLVDHRLEAGRARRKHLWYCRAIFSAIAQHLEAWIRPELSGKGAAGKPA